MLWVFFQRNSYRVVVRRGPRSCVCSFENNVFGGAHAGRTGARYYLNTTVGPQVSPRRKFTQDTTDTYYT